MIDMSRRRLLVTAVSAAMVCAAGCLARPFAGGGEFPVLGWYPSWGRYNGEYLPEDVPFEKLDMMYFANVEPEPDGTVVFASDTDEPNLTEFRNLKQDGGPAEDVRMGFAIGGWNSSRNFSDATLTRENRERFAATAIEMMREYDFDGFEIDWEYPTGGGRSWNVERNEDVENVVKLVEECRRQLDEAMDEDGREYSLSYSAPAEPSHITPLDVETLADLLDWINVMSYDLVDESSATTGHNAPVYGSPSANEAVETWDAEGIARSKMMIGHPFYGRGFDGVAPGSDGDGLDQPFEKYEKTLDYGAIRDRIDDPGWDRNWDETARAPHLYNVDERNWVSATDPEYIKAMTSYALEEGCRGVFCWELSYDPSNELLDAMNGAIDGYGGIL